MEKQSHEDTLQLLMRSSTENIIAVRSKKHLPSTLFLHKNTKPIFYNHSTNLIRSTQNFHWIGILVFPTY